MHTQIKDQIIVNAPASKSWRILAHEFDNIDRWSSGIAESKPLIELSIPDGANVGGRVCLSDGIGGDVEEAFTYYDEHEMRFGYKGLGELPLFMKSAENNWAVHAIDSNTSKVEFRAEVEIATLPALFMMPLMPILKKVLGTRTLEELKHYIENDTPHPRKLKSQQKQAIIP